MELRTYEGMFMLEPTKAAQEWDNIKKQIIGMVERRDGVLVNARKWGEKKLAYEIDGHKRAAYLLMYFQMPPASVNVLRRDLQLSEIVMRTLILAQPKFAAKEEQQRQLDKAAENSEQVKDEEISGEQLEQPDEKKQEGQGEQKEESELQKKESESQKEESESQKKESESQVDNP